MTPRPYIHAETTWRAVRETRFEVAVLPWGATEAHNYHLPYGTDNIECDAVAAESARRAWERGARVAVLPTVPFGVNTTQLDIPLTVNLNPSTQLALLGDVAAALGRQEIPKLVVLNGHGGNDFRQMIRELQPRVPTFLCTLDWFRCLDPSQYFEEQGDHGGELETSLMMHVAPGVVLPLEVAGDGRARRFKVAAFREGWAWAPRRWREVTADTGIGNPARSTAEKGRRYFDDLTERIAGFLLELAAADASDLYEGPAGP